MLRSRSDDTAKICSFQPEHHWRSPCVQLLSLLQSLCQRQVTMSSQF